MKINEMTIREAHEHLKNKDFSCVDFVTACFERIKKYDEEIGAFLTLCEESALEEALAVDEKISGGEEIGILEGIPYSAKDVLLTEDVRTTGGSKILDPYIAPYDARVIELLKKAGAILVGKTNCDAFGHGSSTENSDYFVTKNPWDTSRVAGGSSGGSAASVAMGMCLFSLGEDTGGSIRQPAALCNVTGLKTSYGRVSRFGSIAYASSLDTVGPFGKTAEDCAIVLSCIAGLDRNDHSTLPKEVPDYASNLEGKTLKIGLPKEYFSEALDPRIKERMDEAVVLLKSLGHEVKEISLPTTEYYIASYYVLAAAETSTNLARLDGIRYGHRTKDFDSLEELYVKSRGEGFGPEAKRRIMIGTYTLSAGYVDAYYKKAQKVRTLIREDFDRVFEEVDIILSPTSPFTAFKVGEKAADPLSMYLADIYTVGFSLGGLPTISVPCGEVDSLPVGMQITAPYFMEERVFQLAHAYQKASDFHLKTSPLFS